MNIEITDNSGLSTQMAVLRALEKRGLTNVFQVSPINARESQIMIDALKQQTN